MGQWICLHLFEIGGLCGSLVAGWASDMLFNAYRGPVNLSLCPWDYTWYHSLIWFFRLAGMPIFGFVTVFFNWLYRCIGPQMLIGIVCSRSFPQASRGRQQQDLPVSLPTWEFRLAGPYR